MELADHDRAFWDDGEWVSWDEINQQIEYKEWRAKYPNADISLVPIFESLLSTACSYNAHTGQHLQVYGDIGELYGAITHGIRLNRNYAQGSDGRLGNDLIEIKTITPFKRTDTVEINMARNFSNFDKRLFHAFQGYAILRFLQQFLILNLSYRILLLDAIGRRMETIWRQYPFRRALSPTGGSRCQPAS